jgi:phage tail sheath gpL-like
MSTTPTVLGNVPLEYTDPNTGKQVSIPLNALFFDPAHNNQLSINTSIWTPAVPAFIAKLLADLAQQQLIVPAPVASPKPALVITASDAGSSGNNIQVVFAITGANADPTQVTFSMTVTETDTYTGLSLTSGAPTYIETVLGSDTVKSPSPGLAHVVHGSLGTAGTPVLPSPATFKVTNPNPNARCDVKSSDATPKLLFTLEAKKKGKDGEQTSVLSVGANAKDATLFDLSIQWQQQATGLTLANVQANVKTALCYEIMVSPPSSGVYSIPAAGTLQLTGGTDGASAAKASAIVFAGQ